LCYLYNQVAISAFILHLVRFLKGLAVEIWKEEIY
jgi:hypothetical protein